MSTAFDEQRGIPDPALLSYEERLALLFECEQAHRHDRRLARLLRVARKRNAACDEDANFRATRSLERGRLLQLAGGGWIRQHQTLLITGLKGTGRDGEDLAARLLAGEYRLPRGTASATSACRSCSGRTRCWRGRTGATPS